MGPEVGTKAIRKFVKRYSKVRLRVFAPTECRPNRLPRAVEWYDLQPGLFRFHTGRPSKKSGNRALIDLNAAIDCCLKGEAQALVTGPLDKYWCAQNLPSFTGHTEHLRERTRSRSTTMLLCGGQLRVALVTTHCPLSKVAQSLSLAKIIQTAQHLHDFLRINIRNPKIAVLGLNPHASDRGLLGCEEEKIIEPSIQRLRKLGISCEGPFPADSFFHKYKDFDGIVAMYHDQGLIPLKMIHFYDAVNITLGLPFLRTSVDHGTAFEIAGKGLASSCSYENALEQAYVYAQKTSSH